MVAAEDNIVRPIVPVIVKDNGSSRSKVVYGMLDSGADRDVISETVIKDLAIETTTTNMRVITVDNEMVSKRTMASFIIESLDGNYVANVTEALVG